MELKGLHRAARAACASLRARLDAFLAWWAKELLALLPRGLRERLRGRGRVLRVDFDGATAVFTLTEPAGDRRIAELAMPVDPGAAGEAIRTACGAPVHDVVVHVPPTRVLRRTLTLPLAAEKNLREVLAFEMDRHTPFRAEQVYYDFAVLGRDPAGRQLRTALALVTRKEVDPLLAALRQEGLEPKALHVGDDPVGGDGMNLLPIEGRARRARAQGWPDRALATLAVFLLSTAVALPFVQKLNAAARLEREVAAARQEAQTAGEVRKELERRVAEEQSLVGRRRARPSVIEVLDEVTRLLPDSTWLNRLELSNGRVRLRGESADASGLATLIEHSALLRDASFDASVTRDVRNEQERFVLSATAVPSGPP